MSENIPTNENGVEKIPREREVLNIIEKIIGNDYEVLRNLEDEKGLYLLEVQTTDESGDLVQYNYQREGAYKEGKSLDTIIDVVFFSDGIPVGGHTVAKYKEGTWVEES